jgi:cytosine deaminase
MGTANMLQVLHMGLHVCQIMGYEQINDSLKLIGSHSARTLNVQDRYGIEVGKPANLLILPAENGFDAVRRRCRYVIPSVMAESSPILARPRRPPSCECRTVDFRR